MDIQINICYLFDFIELYDEKYAYGGYQRNNNTLKVYLDQINILNKLELINRKI